MVLWYELVSGCVTLKTSIHDTLDRSLCISARFHAARTQNGNSSRSGRSGRTADNGIVSIPLSLLIENADIWEAERVNQCTKHFSVEEGQHTEWLLITFR